MPDDYICKSLPFFCFEDDDKTVATFDQLITFHFIYNTMVKKFQISLRYPNSDLVTVAYSSKELAEYDYAALVNAFTTYLKEKNNK